MAFSQFNSTIGVKRITGEYANGIYVKNDPIEFDIRGSVQPMTPKELEPFKEGRRIKGAFNVYTFKDIKDSDILILFGEEYEIMKLDIWQNKVISHYKAGAIRVQV